MPYDEKTALYWRIEGLLSDAIWQEEQAKLAEDKHMVSWHKRESKSKFEQAEWAERRLTFLKAGTK